MQQMHERKDKTRGQKMIEVGRLCIKTAGRDSGKECLIVEIIDDGFVIIDGLTRRRKCNISHLEPTEKILKIKEKADHDEVIKALEKEGIKVKEKKVVRKAKEGKTEKPAKQAKKTVKKETKKKK